MCGLSYGYYGEKSGTGTDQAIQGRSQKTISGRVKLPGEKLKGEPAYNEPSESDLLGCRGDAGWNQRRVRKRVSPEDGF